MFNETVDLSGIRSQISRLENQIRGLYRVHVVVPSGQQGLNATFNVLGEWNGNIEADSSSISPFTAFLKTDGNNETMVIVNGILVKTVVPYATMTIQGMNTSLGKTAGTKVWIEVQIDNALKATSASIKSGSSWPEYATYIGASPYTQTQATCRIGMVVDGELPQGTPGFGYTLNDKPVHFLQQVSTNLCMMACAIDGKATMLPLPFAG